MQCTYNSLIWDRNPMLKQSTNTIEVQLGELWIPSRLMQFDGTRPPPPSQKGLYEH